MHKQAVKIASNAKKSKILIKTRGVSLTDIITYDDMVTIKFSLSQQNKKEINPKVKLFTVELARDIFVSSWPTIIGILSCFFYNGFTL